MKKIAIIIISLFTIISCTSRCFEVSQIMINDSGREVTITSYRFYYDQSVSKEFKLKNEEQIQIKDRTCPDNQISFRDLVKGDSIVIDYGDRIKYYSTRFAIDERNPYYLDRIKKSDDFVYTITPEDYTNATTKP